jgi:hypothetical protein
MAKVKNKDFPTRASAMIPLSVNFTTDGISGLNMGQAFTLPPTLMPYTYNIRGVDTQGLGKDYVNKVGFLVVGLNHSISDNVWNTSVKANMTFLKDIAEYSSSVSEAKKEERPVAKAANFDATGLTGDPELYWFANLLHNQGSCGAPSILKAASLQVPIMDSGADPNYEGVKYGCDRPGKSSIQYNMFGKSDPNYAGAKSSGNVGGNFRSVVETSGGSLSPLYTAANFLLYKKYQFQEKYNSANSTSNATTNATVIQYIESAATKYGVPADFLKYVAYSESGFKPESGNATYKGIFALSEAEFKKYVPNGDIFNAKDNIEAGTQILKIRLSEAANLRGWYYAGMTANPYTYKV